MRQVTVVHRPYGFFFHATNMVYTYMYFAPCKTSEISLIPILSKIPGQSTYALCRAHFNRLGIFYRMGISEIPEVLHGRITPYVISSHFSGIYLIHKSFIISIITNLATVFSALLLCAFFSLVKCTYLQQAQHTGIQTTK